MIAPLAQVYLVPEWDGSSAFFRTSPPLGPGTPNSRDPIDRRKVGWPVFHEISVVYVFLSSTRKDSLLLLPGRPTLVPASDDFLLWTLRPIR